MSKNNYYFELQGASDSYNYNVSLDNIFPLEKVENSSYSSVYYDLEDLHKENEMLSVSYPRNH